MVGLSIKLNKIIEIFPILFKNLDPDFYIMDVSLWESYGNGDFEFSLNEFDSSEKCRTTTIKEILYQSELYPEFAELFIRKKTDVSYEVNDYISFLKSNYFLSIIIYDRRNIDVICKDEGQLTLIHDELTKACGELVSFVRVDFIRPDAVLKAWRSKNEIGILDK